MSHYIIGVDPGFSGGISILDVKSQTLQAANTPTFQGEKKTEYDLAGMVSLFEMSPESVKMVYLEQVGARPGQGTTSMFRFGMGYGIWQGIIAAKRYPMRLVIPQRWKKQFQLGADKEESRLKASQLFPLCTDFWRRKKDDGVAESALLTMYGALESGLNLGNITPYSGTR